MVREDLAKNGAKLPKWLGGASLGQAAFDAISTVSNMAPSILASTAVGLINPAAGAAVGSGLLGASAAGNAYTEMLNQGYSPEEARLYGVAVGVSEVVMERALGGISKLGGNALSKTALKNFAHVDNVLTRFAKSAGGRLLAGASSEALEEGLQSIIEPYLRYAAAQDKTEISVDMQEALYSALMGFATGGLFEAVNPDTYQKSGGAADSQTVGNDRFSVEDIQGELADYGTGVLLDTNLFDGIRPRAWADVLSKYVYDNFAGQSLTVYDESGNAEVIQFARENDRVKKDGAKNSHKVLDKIARKSGDNIGSLAVVHLPEILQTSKYENSTDEHSHQWMDEKGWEYRKAYLQDRNGNIYEATLNIANGNDRRILYAINNIRQIDKKRAARGVVPSTEERKGLAHNDSSSQEQIVSQSVAEVNNSQESVDLTQSILNNWNESYGLTEARPAEQTGNDSENMNGGTDNGTGVLHGSSQRNDGESAGEPAGGLAGRAGTATERNRSAVDRIRKTNERRALGKNLRLEKVSSLSLGVVSGTERANLQVIPEEHWDDGLRAKANQVMAETGKSVVYVLGNIETKGVAGKTVRVRGVITESSIVVQADNAKLSAEQIADHEAYHGMADVYRESRLNDRLIEWIRNTFTKEEFDKVVDRYILSLRETIDVDGAQTGEEKAKRIRKVQEEVLADAYAGLNSFGNSATAFTDTVRSYLRDNHISRENSQDNGTEQPTGPPAGQKENTAEFGGERYLREDNVVDLSTNNELSARIGSLRGAEKYKVIQQYILEVLQDQPITLSDGKKAVVDKRDALHIANKSGTEKTSQIAEIKKLIETAVLYAEDLDAEHGKFDQFYYYVTDVRFDGDVFPLYLNVGRAKNDGSYHIYDITKKIRDTADRTNGLERPVHDTGNALESDTSTKIIRSQVEKVKEKIKEVLDSVSVNHAAQMESYTRNKDSNPELAQKFYDGLVDGMYADQFAEYLKLTEELERLESEASAVAEPETDVDGAEFVERMSVDDSAAEDPEQNDISDPDRAKAELIEGLRGLSPTQMMGEEIGKLIDQYTKQQPVKTQAPKVKVDRGNLRRALTSTLGLSKEQSAQLKAVLDTYTEAVTPKRKPGKKSKADVKVDVESRPTQAKKNFQKKMLDIFSVPTGKRAELAPYIGSFADRIVKNGALTEADRRAFFAKMYDAGVMTVPAEEAYSNARNYLNKGRIYVNESIRAEFGDDWNSFRKQAFANGIYLTADKADAGVDVWQQRLYEDVGLIDPEETSMKEVLERIVQIAEEGRDERVSLAEYVAIVAGEEFTSEDEILDGMERQMEWALKSFAEAAKVEVQLRDRNMRRVLQEREENRAAAQRQRDQNELRELQQKTLKQLQWLNRNRYRAPEELQQTWDEVLGDIDLYAVGAANEMNWSDKHNATWKDLAQMYKDAKEKDPNFLPSEELERIVTRLDATKIGDMDFGALQDLYKAAVGLRTEFYNRNNVINDEKQRLFAEVYTDSKKEIEEAPGGYSGKKMDKLMNLDQLTPMNILQRMGGWDPDGVFYSMAKQLERGERDVRGYHVRANAMLQEFLETHQDWVEVADGQGKDGIWYEIEVPELLELGMGHKPIFGDTVRVYMTPSQKVHMYLESKNMDNLRHMTGGRTFADKALYSKGKRQEALAQGRTIKLAPETVKQIVSDLTAEEMELARLLEQYYNSFATGEINRVSNVLYGYDKAMGKNYAPIYTNRNYTKTEFGVFDVTAEGVGNLKGRQYAVNPSYNISAFDAFERHVDQTARFVGMAIPARNWTTLMNWREKNNSTGDVITHKWGEEGKKYITDLITTLQAGDDVKHDAVSDFINKLQSNYITAIFGMNPSIVLKQLGSIPMAGVYLGPANVPRPAQVAGIDRELIAKYTPDLTWRTLGYTTMETKQLKENPNWTETNKVVRFAFGGGAITAMDGWAASTLWPWAENKVRKEHPELDVGTPEQIQKGESAFYMKVAEEFENAVSRSQSVSDEIHQGKLRKSKNPFTRAFTLFKSDSAQTYNAIRQKIGEARYYSRVGAPKEIQRSAKVAVGAAVGAMMINALWGASVSFLMALWKNKAKNYRDDEDELTAESVIEEMVMDMLGSIAGTVVGAEELYEVIGNLLTGEKLYGIDTPGMEQLNDFIETVGNSGGDMRDVIAGAVDVLKNGGNLGLYFSGCKGKIVGAVKDITQALAMYLAGVPVSNTEAYLMGAVKWLSPELGATYDELYADVGKTDLAGLEGEALSGRIGRVLDGRGVQCAEDTVVAIAALYENGHKGAFPADAPASMTIKEQKYDLNNAQKQTYEKVWGDAVSSGLDELVGAEAFQNAEAKTQAAMLCALYEYGTARAKAEVFDEYKLSDSDEKTVEAVKAGAGLGEYLAWRVVTKDMKKAEKLGELVTWDMSDDAKKAVVGAVLGTEMETDSGNPSQYAKFISVLETGLSVDGYLEMCVEGSDVDKYLKYTEAGLDPQEAVQMVNALGGLKGSDEKVTDLQRWRAAVDSQSGVDDQMSALSAVMDEKPYQKVELANEYGVKPDAYVQFLELLPEYNEDGKGSPKQQEITSAINAVSGKLRLTNEQKAVLWQIAADTKSAKNNPYSVEIGWKVVDALSDETLSFGEMFMRQVMAGL